MQVCVDNWSSIRKLRHQGAVRMRQVVSGGTHHPNLLAKWSAQNVSPTTSHYRSWSSPPTAVGSPPIRRSLALGTSVVSAKGAYDDVTEELFVLNLLLCSLLPCRV